MTAVQAATATKPKKPKKKLGSVHVDQERCKGCGFCVAFCPTHVLEMSRQFNQKGYHPPEVADGDSCTACDLCGMFCPDFAIYSTRD